MVTYCFNRLNLHRLTAGCATKNKASVKVLEKCVFTREAYHKRILPIRGEWQDNYEYAILEDDFFKLKQSLQDKSKGDQNGRQMKL